MTDLLCMRVRQVRQVGHLFSDVSIDDSIRSRDTKSKEDKVHNTSNQPLTITLLKHHLKPPFLVTLHTLLSASFRENLCWSICDGQPDSLLHDAWISDLGLLSNHLLNVPYIPTHAKVIDFVDTDGKWKWIDSQRFFSREVLEHIVACHPPCDELGEDKCLWRSNASRKFSGKEAYKSLV
ncbi:hypothetical protein J1N35_021240 [Gossypium stocksii]|uniref:Uncharacterized protein n=1 Tax=Gossypium stocksii TaxID=47602 RepID=A0A9D3VFH0_9ROSI|nr:hypothetical protein J1N35_021240 [Gossypium stocksii]